MTRFRELRTDFTQLSDRTAIDHPAYGDFVKAMKDRAFGGEALDDAWCWFSFGWEAAVDR